MGAKKSVFNILRVMFGNITTILSGVVVAFLLPKVLSLEDYGYYKTFTLYVTYTGLCSFGLIDGIVLRHGGDNYEDLDKPRFRAYARWFLLLLGAFAFLLLVGTRFLQEEEMAFLFEMVALDLVAGNLVNYFRQLSQITQRFREYSMRTVIQSGLKIAITLTVIWMALTGLPVNDRLYLGLVVISDYIMVLWYGITYRDVLFGPAAKMSGVLKEVIELIRIGIPLMCANLNTALIMALDRQFVSVLFSTKEYAIYAFAYNMLTLVTVAISAVSTVLYPVLKRADREELKNRYPSLVSLMMVLVFGTLLIYFPLCWILEAFLPVYLPSIPIFRIIFPGLAISSAISIVMSNYCKVFDRSASFFRRSTLILVLSAVLNLAAWCIFGTMEAISATSVLTLLVWYLCTEDFLARCFDCPRAKNLLYLGSMTLLFYGTASLDTGKTGLFFYLVGYGVLTGLFFRAEAEAVFRRIKK